MGRTIKRQRTIVARIARQMERGASALTQAVREALQSSLAKARQIVDQAAILMQETGQKPLAAYVDLGYRGVEQTTRTLPSSTGTSARR